MWRANFTHLADFNEEGVNEGVLYNTAIERTAPRLREDMRYFDSASASATRSPCRRSSPAVRRTREMVWDGASSGAEHALRHALSGPSFRYDGACEKVEAIIQCHGWAEVQPWMLQLLRLYEEPVHWLVAAEVFWGAVLDERDMDADVVIAHLYFRLPPDDEGSLDHNRNLAWSIVTKLKGVGYLSDYDPLRDSGVEAVLDGLRRDQAETRGSFLNM